MKRSGERCGKKLILAIITCLILTAGVIGGVKFAEYMSHSTYRYYLDKALAKSTAETCDEDKFYELTGMYQVPYYSSTLIVPQYGGDYNFIFDNDYLEYFRLANEMKDNDESEILNKSSILMDELGSRANITEYGSEKEARIEFEKLGKKYEDQYLDQDTVHEMRDTCQKLYMVRGRCVIRIRISNTDEDSYRKVAEYFGVKV